MTRLLGKDAGGCSRACSEMHTFSWPCELSVMPDDEFSKFSNALRSFYRTVWGEIEPKIERFVKWLNRKLTR